jgi:hypothetical protein
MSGIPIFKAILENSLSILSEPTVAVAGAPGRTVSRNGWRLFAIRTLTAQVSPARRRNWMLALMPLLLAATGAQAQAVFSTPIAVGGTNPQTEQTVTVTAPAGGTVANVAVLTMGVPNLDFQTGNGSSCVSATALAPGGSCQQSVSFTPSAPGLRSGAVVLFDSGGNVLGTTYISGTGLGGLGVFVPGNIVPVAGDGDYKDAVVDGIPATEAELYLPSGITLDGAGNLYIADTLHFRIRMVCASSTSAILSGTSAACAGPGIITTIAGNTASGNTGNNGPASLATLNLPSAVALDGAGNLYIADTGNNVIRMISAASGIITTVAGGGSGCGGQTDNVGDGCLATSGKLNSPQGVTVDFGGNIFISDTANQRIRRVDAVTGIITTVAGDGFTNPDGSGGYSGDTHAATLAELNAPEAVAFDPAGNMYIADSANNVVREVSAASGIISTFAGTGTAGYSGDGGKATAADLRVPSGVVVDPGGNIYIADTQNEAIRKVTSASSSTPGIISAIAASQVGEYYFAGNFSQLFIYGPIGLFLDSSGNLYFADSLNMEVREIQSNYVALDFTGGGTPTPVRQGSLSATQDQTVENDGNAPLDLTGIVVGTNAAIDPTVANSCAVSPPDLAVDSDCVIGAVFAPSLTPAITGNTAENGNIDIAGDTQAAVVASNSPLDIEVFGIASPVNEATITLVSSLNPSGFGNPVTFTATVSTGTGTGALTGTVTFSVDGTAVQSNTALGTAVTSGSTVSATATFLTSTLTVGAHTISAVYVPGSDVNHYAGPPASLTQNVLEGTVTTLVSSSNPSLVGASVTFTATVAIGPNGGAVAPAGSVQFNDGSTILASVPFTAGNSAQFTTSALTLGVHNIVAYYLGDPAVPDIQISNSTTLNQDVQSQSSVVLTSSTNPSNYGSSVTFTATVTPTGGTSLPTDTVTFLDSGTPLGAPVALGSSLQATFTTSTLIAGMHTITASYSGDSNNSSSTSAPLSQVVNKVTPTITWAPPAAISYGTALSATQLDALSSVPGTFTYTPASGAVLTAGLQTLSVMFTPTDATDYNTTSATVSLTVNKTTPAITWATPASISYGTPLSVTQLDASSTVAGSFAYTPASGTVLTVGAQTLSVTLTPTDTTDYNPATATVTLTVNRAVLSLTWASPAPIAYGTALSATQLDATSSVGGTFAYTPAPGTVLTAGSQTLSVTFTPTDTTDYSTTTDTVTLTVNKATLAITWATPPAIAYGTALSSTQLDASTTVAGTFAYTPPSGAVLAVGSQTLSVTFTPTDTTDYNTATDTVTLTVNKTTPGTTLTAVPTTGIAGAPVTLTATVTTFAGAPSVSGNATFSDTFGGATVTLGSTGLLSGSASISPTLAPGLHSIVATYSGDSNDNSSASSPLAYTVVQAITSAVVSAAPNPSVVFSPVTFTAKVTGNGGIPTGPVTFVADGTAMGSAVNLDATGTAVFTYAGLSVGTHSITVNYGGDINDAASTSAAITQTVGTIPTVTNLGVSATTTTPPVPILVAVVLNNNGGPGPTPTGTITFEIGTLVVGTAPLDSSGVATLTPNLALGTYSMVAVYSGDATHGPSTSAPVSVSGTATGFSIAVSPASVTMAASENATVTVTLTSQSGFTDTIGLGCGSLPAGITCHFTPVSVNLAANATATSSLVIDTGYPLTGGAAAMNSHGRSKGVALAGLLLPLAAFFGLFFRRFRKRHAAMFTMMLILLFSGAAMLVSGCGGISSSSAAPGTYVIQVTGVGANSDLVHYQNVTVTVTQ